MARSCIWPDNLPLSSISGILAGVVVVGVGIFWSWMHKSMRPPPPKICGSPNGPPITSLRVKLKDGRHIAYKEEGIPRHEARYKVIFVHGFNASRHAAPALPKAFIDEHSIYLVSFDRAGYGESDPNPSKNVKSEAQDIEELADLLELGNTFYLLALSMGGCFGGWSCLKYIPHRLAGVGMVVPAVNYWWKCFDKEVFRQAFGTQISRDRWFMWVARHFPRLIYFCISQPWIPKPTLVDISKLPSAVDQAVMKEFVSTMTPEMWAMLAQGPQQGEGETICRDLMVMYSDWGFDPCDVKNPFVDRPGQVHIWQGEEDYLVPKVLQHDIHKKLPWINYHEVVGGGHLLHLCPGFFESALTSLLLGKEFDFKVTSDSH